MLNFRQRRWSDENEFFGELEDRRPERSRGDFVGTVDIVGSSAASSAQLKHFETAGFGGKVGFFRFFWQFSVNPVNSERVLRPVTMQVCARDSVDSCDSKSARNGSLFGCMVTAWGCRSSGKLATV